MKMQTRGTRPLLMGGAALLGAVALSFGGAIAANAHVGLGGSSDEAGTSTLLTFSFSHGCEESPTTGLTIQIPEGINAVTPTVDAGWTVEKVMQDLATPIEDAHGNEITQRVSEVVYTANEPIENGYRAAVVLSLTLPEDAAGTTLAFPTVQRCEVGENAWIQIAEEGQDPHDLDAPAPTIAVTAGALDDEHADGADAADSGEVAVAAAPMDQTGLIVASLVVGSLGLILAAIALLTRGRSKA
jgi:uncharacterized protein YcnI